MAKILIADDHTATRALLAERLAMDGLQVEAVGSADAAFEAFASVRPDAVLVALTLPEGDGGHLARRLRESGGKAPVLVYDAAHRGRGRGIQAILELGAHAYLADPTHHRDLRRRLDGLLAAAEADPADAAGSEGAAAREQGRIRPGVLLELALRAWREKWTGLLVLQAPGVDRRLRLLDGTVVGAASSLRAESLGPWMVEHGRLSDAAWQRALETMAGDGLSATGALVATGALEAGEAVYAALSAHSEDLVVRILGQRGGAWRFVADGAAAREGPVLSLDHLTLVRIAAARHGTTRFFKDALGADLDRFPYRTGGFGEQVNELCPDPPGLAFAMRITGSVPARDLATGERHRLGEALSRLWYLHRTGAVAFSDTPRTSEDAGRYRASSAPRRKKAVPEEEAARLREEAVQILTASYFGALGLDIAAGVEEVERAYDRLARRFHPDTWAEYDVSRLEDVMQTVLDKLQAAYRVLSVEEKRRSYLAFLLSRTEAPARRAPLEVDAEIALRRGVNLMKAGNAKEAVRAFTEALSLNPREPEVHCHLAFAKFRAARGTPARRAREPRLMMRVALLMAPDLPQAHVVMGLLDQEVGHLDAARKRFLKALRLDPGSRSAKAALQRLNRA